MQDIFAVLRQKEIDLTRVRKEIDALYVVIPLLGGELSAAPEADEPVPAAPRPTNKWPLEIQASAS
jgi:hypothetical protein